MDTASNVAKKREENGESEITTSFKTLFYESAAKLLALGFDLQDDKIIIEDIIVTGKQIGRASCRERV